MRNFYRDGIRFECQGSGQCSGHCCRNRGEYMYVYLKLKDRRRLAAEFGLKTLSFTKRFTEKTDGYFHLKQFDEACPFLKNGRCSVYEARPTQCRTWPFWPDNMKTSVWKKHVVPYCPGAGRGRLHTATEIDAIIRDYESGRD